MILAPGNCIANYYIQVTRNVQLQVTRTICRDVDVAMLLGIPNVPEIPGDSWRLLEITGDYMLLLEVTGV